MKKKTLLHKYDKKSGTPLSLKTKQRNLLKEAESYQKLIDRFPDLIEAYSYYNTFYASPSLMEYNGVKLDIIETDHYDYSWWDVKIAPRLKIGRTLPEEYVYLPGYSYPVFDIDYDERSYPKKIRWNNAEKIIQDLGFDQKKIKAMYKAVAERLSKCDKDDLKLLDRSILPEAVKLYMTFS